MFEESVKGGLITHIWLFLIKKNINSLQIVIRNLYPDPDLDPNWIGIQQQAG